MTIHQIKIFNNVEEANAFLAEHKVKVVLFGIEERHDYWQGGTSYPSGSICNQWTEYVLVYELDI